jgi:archaellum component FlaC
MDTEVSAETQVVETQATVDAQAAETSHQETQAAPGERDLGWTDEQKAYIEGLRKESAKYRSRAKNLDGELQSVNQRLSKFESGLKNMFGGEEDQELTPEETIYQLQAHNEALEMQNAITEVALEYGVGAQDMGFFRYLLNERAAVMEEGEELTEDDLEEIISEVRARGGQPANTSVTGDVTASGVDSPEADSGDGVTFEQFQTMSLGEKSALYQKSPDLYNRLAAAAKKARVRI